MKKLTSFLVIVLLMLVIGSTTALGAHSCGKHLSQNVGAVSVRQTQCKDLRNCPHELGTIKNNSSQYRFNSDEHSVEQTHCYYYTNSNCLNRSLSNYYHHNNHNYRNHNYKHH